MLLLNCATKWPYGKYIIPTYWDVQICSSEVLWIIKDVPLGGEFGPVPFLTNDNVGKCYSNLLRWSNATLSDSSLLIKDNFNLGIKVDMKIQHRITTHPWMGSIYENQRFINLQVRMNPKYFLFWLYTVVTLFISKSFKFLILWNCPA